MLERAGLWDAIQAKLLVAENASQAMEFLAHGSSQAGIVPLSLAKAQEIAKLGSFALIPVDSHREEPLKQRMVLLKNAGDTARIHSINTTPMASAWTFRVMVVELKRG